MIASQFIVGTIHAFEDETDVTGEMAGTDKVDFKRVANHQSTTTIQKFLSLWGRGVCNCLNLVGTLFVRYSVYRYKMSLQG